jgi:hypothetical protein
MNQRTHAWIAIRAIKLLEDEGSVPSLVELMKPYTRQASIGAWIPDKRDAKLGSAQTQNHVFKIKPYDGNLKTRFVMSKQKTFKLLTDQRLAKDFLDRHSDILDDAWWKESYKADPPPGKHLANRAMSLSIGNIDLLIMGDPVVQEILPGRIGFISSISDEVKTRQGQVALFFFMLSHFVADSLMPCHCDDRDLSDYDTGLHKELESHWSKVVGKEFDEKSLLESDMSSDQLLGLAMGVDDKFNIQFANVVPDIQTDDIWEEIVLLCRASFAIASVIAPPATYPYKPKPQVFAKYEDLFTLDDAGKSLLEDLDRTVIHDAVLNVAIVWKDIWLKFKDK